MSQKKKDDKNRWLNLTVAFRVSPEENEELNMRVKLSGAETKREYIIQSVLHQQVIAKGNPLMLVTFRRELQYIKRELERQAYLVQAQFRKLNMGHIRYVLDCLAILQPR